METVSQREREETEGQRKETEGQREETEHMYKGRTVGVYVLPFLMYRHAHWLIKGLQEDIRGIKNHPRCEAGI